MRAHEFKRYPEERRGNARALDAALQNSPHSPGEAANQHAPRRGDQQQYAPAASNRQAAMDAQDRGNPRHRREHKKQRVYEAARKSNQRTRSKQNDEKHADTNKRIDAEIKSGERKGKRRSGCGRYNQAQPVRDFRSGFRSYQTAPKIRRHQCFTIALKPAPSRPFRAASAAFWSA